MSLAILCPGQGGQHAGMFARIAQLPAASEVITTAASVLGTDPIALAADPRRFDNAIAQPLVCAGTLAHWQALRAQLPTPTLVLGYSVGELPRTRWPVASISPPASTSRPPAHV